MKILNKFYTKKIINSLKLKNGFATCKIGHVFWEVLALLDKFDKNFVKMDHYLEKHHNYIKSIEESYDVHFDKSNNKNFFKFILNSIHEIPKDKNFYLCCSEEPVPYANQIEGTPFYQIDKIINKYVPSEILEKSKKNLLKGSEFKIAFITGEISDFFKRIKNKNVLFILPYNLKSIENFFNLKNFKFYFTNGKTDHFIIEHHLLNIENEANKNNSEILIFGMGGSTSFYIISKLFKKYNNRKFYDFGGALSVFNYEVAKNSNWVKYFYPFIVESLRSLNEEWLKKNYNLESLKFRKRLLIKPIKKKISFLENKKIDYEILKNSMKDSESNNHYANFGPAYFKLKKYLENNLKGLNGRKIIILNSCTSGIQLLSNFFQYKVKKKIDFIISDFNFFSSNCLGLSKSKIVDCNVSGIIDLKIIKKNLFLKKKNNYGVIFTNIFGQNSDWNGIKEYCEKNDMPFFVDNAMGLHDRPLKNNENTFEVISFHQTKLWGIGEGGCIICPAKYHDQLKDFINFGVKNFNLNKKYSSNYKIPDINCALIFQRLQFLSVNERFYFAIQRRIKKIILRNSFDLRKFEVDKNSNSPQTFTPYTSSKIIKQSDLDKTKFIQLRKYYKPLISLKNSNKIYQNIVCIPNNPDLMNLTDEQIENDLRLILN